MQTEQDMIQTAAASDVIQLQEITDLDAGRSLTSLALRRLRRDYLTLGSMLIIAILVVAAVGAPLIEQYFGVDYRTTELSNRYQDLGTENHPLGTDNLGRDHLSRLLYGGRISLGIGFAAGVLSIVIGLTIGLVAGYNQGGRFGVVDDAIMWFITTLNSIPQLFLLIIIAAVLTPSVFTLIMVLAILGWTGTMRLVRGETLAQRSREYVLAAQSIGAGPLRVMFNHIMPNVFSVLIVTLMISIGNLILVEAALSFLSLGVQEPTPSWGNMLVKAQEFFREAPHLAVVPGILISLTVLCLYIIGDGLRDAFDPQAIKR